MISRSVVHVLCCIKALGNLWQKSCGTPVVHLCTRYYNLTSSPCPVLRCTGIRPSRSSCKIQDILILKHCQRVHTVSETETKLPGSLKADHRGLSLGQAKVRGFVIQKCCATWLKRSAAHGCHLRFSGLIWWAAFIIFFAKPCFVK